MAPQALVNKSDLEILQWNSRSVKNKEAELKKDLKKNKYDIVAIQETWLKEKSKISFDSYEIIRNDRKNRQAGGVMFLIKNTLQIQTKNLTLYQNGHCEVQVIQIKLSNGVIDILNIYNPRQILSKNEFNFYLDQLGPQYLIVGDFNAHHSLWEPSKNSIPNHCGRIVHEILDEDNRITLATPPDLHTYTDTRTGEQSTIDLCFCNPQLFPLISMRTMADLGSDHMPILTKIAIKAEESVRGKRKQWIFEEGNWKNWENKMKVTTVTPGSPNEESGEFINSMIDISKEVFKQTSNKVKQKYNKPWWSEECSRAIAIRRRAKRRMERSGRRFHIMEYRRAAAAAQRILNKTRRASWRKYVSKINSNTTSKEIWDILSKFKGKYRTSYKPIEYQGTTHYTAEKRGEAIGKFFQSVMTKDRNINYPQEMINRIQEAKSSSVHKHYNNRFNLWEIKEVIEDLPSNKSCGRDEVHNLFLKHLPENKVRDLLGIMNRSWRQGILPDEWKIALIIPIPKPDKDLQLPSSYRPISLLSCVSKLMENMVGKRLVYEIERNDMFSRTQYGFRFRRGTIDPVIGLEHEIHTGVKLGKVTIVVFFDIKSAYDTVDHKYLLNMLTSKGIKGTMLKWIENFLTGRKIQISIEDKLSDEYEIDNGVPQGSGISTALFDMIISNIPQLKIAPVNSKEFADDVAFSVTSDTLEDAELLMQDAIERLEEHIKSVGLKISAAKTKVMCFTLKRKRIPFLTLEGELIEVVSDFKYLGMVFDAPRLTWTKHVQYIRSKCQQGINILKCISSSKWGADRKCLIQINNALVRSKLSYGCQALISISKTNANKLEVVQNQGLRIATGCLKTTKISTLQAEANIMPLDMYMKKEALKYYYKIRAQKNNHSVKEIIFEDIDLANQVWNENVVKKPFILKIKDILRQWRLPERPHQEEMEYPEVPPWEEITSNISTELISKVTKSEGEIQVRQAALETIHLKYKNYIPVYTDGSKKERPLSTTAAYCIPSKNIEEKWKLHPNISIEGAELSAILKATEWILTLDETIKNVAIFTDSKVGLFLILNRKPKTYVYSVSKIQNNIRKIKTKGWKIALQWIPSHCGIPGNDKADSLANQAHELIDMIEYPLEIKELEVLIKNAGQRKWQNIWDLEKGNSALGLRKPTLEDWVWCRHEDRETDVALTRLRTEASRLQEYMHEMGLVDDSICPHCTLNVEESVPHFLIECPSMNLPRNILKASLERYGIVRINSDLLLGYSNEDLEVKKLITQAMGRFLKMSGRLGTL